MGKINSDEPQLPLPPELKKPDSSELDGPGRILGIDVSHYEPSIDFALAKTSGVGWMFAKATEGTKFVDALLKQHATNAKTVGIAVGAYHFFRANFSGIDQANFFLQTCNATGLNFDLLCLDWEQGSGDGVNVNIQKNEALAFLKRIEEATKKTPIIYGGEAFLRDLGLSSDFKRYPLWLAHYGVTEAKLKVPAPWTDWTMWQFTDAGLVKGLAAGHHVDCNYFKGTLADLEKLCKN